MLNPEVMGVDSENRVRSFSAGGDGALGLFYVGDHLGEYASPNRSCRACSPSWPRPRTACRLAERRPATSVTSIDYSGSKKGTFSTDPAEFTKGDKVKLTGNFPDSSANLVVTFYKETSPGSSNYDSVGTDESNQYGNAYFLDYQVDAKQRMFARTSKGLVTELDTLDPKIPPDPDTCSTAGTLTSNPAFITTGSKVQLWANYENDQSGAKVDFYKKGSPNVLLGSTTANSTGNAYLKDFEVKAGTQEVFAISSRTSARRP